MAYIDKKIAMQYLANSEKIFDKIYGNYELSLTLSHHFKKLCELSPHSYIFIIS